MRLESINPHSEFKGLRAIFWPIHPYELKKFLPLGLMMFCALFNYTIIRNLKDAIVVKSMGADTISFIEFGVVLPCSILFVLVYNKMSNILSRANLFSSTTLVFLIFFGVFGFYLYPNREAILPSRDTINFLMENVPYTFLGFLVKMYANWILVLFYMMAELWGAVVISLLFWQFTNNISLVSEAKRFYALFGLIGNLGAILSGQVLMYLMNKSEFITLGINTFETSLKVITIIFLCFGGVFIVLHRWTMKQLKGDPTLDISIRNTFQTQKLTLSLGESFKMILSSRYLILILLVVVGYGISINLIETTWKKMIDIQFSNENNYANFMGKFSLYMGLMTIVFMIIGQNIVRLLGWYKAALVTPLMILITGGLFFCITVYRDDIIAMHIFVGALTNPIMLAVWIGQIQNILSKATKYSLFDPTKEMTYIPLDEELKTKGKAAVDVIGSRLGKSGGALIQILLLAILAVNPTDPNAQLIIAPYLFGFLLIIVIAWIYAITGLNKAFTILTQKRETEQYPKD